MSDIDDTIRRDIHQRLDRLEVSTAGRAEVVRSDLRRSRRRRVLITAAGAAVVAGAAAAIYLTSGHTDHAPEPAGRLRIIRTLSDASLGLTHPQAAAIGPNGNLYITDDKHDTVTEATPAGRVIRTWGGPGIGQGQFLLGNPAQGYIAVDQQGRVYVADSNNSRVQEFTGSGKFIRQLGPFSGTVDQLLTPTSVAVGTDGSVYVADDRRATLTKISASGHPDWLLTVPGEPPDLVGHTHFGALDSHGRLVVANDDTSRIVYISPEGQEVDAFGQGKTADHASDFPQGACDTTVDSHDYVYVAGCIVTKKTGALIQTYDPSHHLVRTWPDSPLVTAPRFGPHGLAVAVGHDSILVLRDR